MTRASRPFLAVDLLGGAADGGALFGGRRSSAPRGELRFDDFVKELLFDFSAEHVVRQVELSDFFAFEIEDVDLGHVVSVA